MRRTWLVLALVATLIWSISVAVPPAVATPSPPPGVPAGLKKCTMASEAYCGSVVVPLDRTGATVGTITIRFEYYPRSDTSRPQLSIVAHEGGPGYSTTASRSLYLDLYRPLMTRRALLLVDERGTGLSGALYCPEAASYVGDWSANAEVCADRLGSSSDLYTTAAAVEDMVAVLDELEIERIDLYGDSYGSFFSQTFAVRHPDYLRSLVLDATYPIEGLDPWYRTTPERLRENLALFCSRSPATCPVAPDEMVELTRQVAASLRADPVTATAPDAFGSFVTVTLTARRLFDTLLYTDVTPGYVREYPPRRWRSSTATSVPGADGRGGVRTHHGRRDAPRSLRHPSRHRTPRSADGPTARTWATSATTTRRCGTCPRGRAARSPVRGRDRRAAAGHVRAVEQGRGLGVGVLRLRLLHPLARAARGRAAVPHRAVTIRRSRRSC